MKTLFLSLVFIVSITINLFPQTPIFLEDNTCIGKSHYALTYSLLLVSDTTQPNKEYTDNFVLQCGDKLSRFYNSNLFHFDSTYTSYIGKGKESYPRPQGVYFPEEVLKYFQENKMAIMHRMPLATIFRYEEPFPQWKWQMRNETKEILGYTCCKAQCEFHGREWTAWFTNQIPISDGPWKFCGLPGLILQISDSKGHYSFCCTSLKKIETPIFKYDDNYYTETNREDMNRLLTECYADLYAYSRRVNPGKPLFGGKRDKNGNVTIVEISESEKKVIPYNPIELE